MFTLTSDSLWPQICDASAIEAPSILTSVIACACFGGNKASGNGREGIHDTLHEMTREKTLLLHEVFA